MSEVETIRIKTDKTDENPLGYIVINKADKTDDQVLFEDSDEKKPDSKDVTVATKVANPSNSTSGNKNADGGKVTESAPTPAAAHVKS